MFLDGSLSKTFRVRTYKNGKGLVQDYLVHNSFFFLSYSMFACAMYWFLVITFFSTSVPLIWSTESVDSVGTTIFTLPKVISSFIFYWYQFDVCLFSNECQQYVFLVFLLLFFSTFIWFFLVHRHVLTQ